MRLPDALREPVDAMLEGDGLGRVRTIEPVGGGCIAETGRLRTSAGADFFLKWSTSSAHPAGLFAAEAASLGAIAASATIRVPAVVHVRDVTPPGTPADGAARWLLMEWLEPGPAAAHTWTSLGRDLVALHRTRADNPGWPADNFIGTLPQANAPTADWPAFWRERRLLPQVERARDAGLLEPQETERFDRLLARLDELLSPADADGLSLLHGDLWSGNLHVVASGDPAVVDPSSSFGHREVDLAMSQLFGGFDYLFYAAYEEAWPLQPEYEKVRRPLYQLYYLLVHVNMFGQGYRARTLAALRAIGF